MKNFVLGILVTVVMMFTIASTVPNGLIVIKPAMPKNVVVFTGSLDQIRANILNYSKQGYIVKTVNLLSIDSHIVRNHICVMERY